MGTSLTDICRPLIPLFTNMLRYYHATYTVASQGPELLYDSNVYHVHAVDVFVKYRTLSINSLCDIILQSTQVVVVVVLKVLCQVLKFSNAPVLI
jgi:hypothetical protein